MTLSGDASVENRAYRLPSALTGKRCRPRITAIAGLFGQVLRRPEAVSYTHLDVYKRQVCVTFVLY